jgi:GxxExxY protein
MSNEIGKSVNQEKHEIIEIGDIADCVMEDKILFKEECYAVQGAIFEVYRTMGCGFLEAVYQECLEIEFDLQKIPFNSQPDLRITYKEKLLKQTYKPDFICFEKIIIEIKAVKELTPDHSAQILNYLNATKFNLGILVNFGSYPKAAVKRFVI